MPQHSQSILTKECNLLVNSTTFSITVYTNPCTVGSACCICLFTNTYNYYCSNFNFANKEQIFTIHYLNLFTVGSAFTEKGAVKCCFISLKDLSCFKEW